jgi:hypothetical protein
LVDNIPVAGTGSRREEPGPDISEEGLGADMLEEVEVDTLKGIG